MGFQPIEKRGFQPRACFEPKRIPAPQAPFAASPIPIMTSLKLGLICGMAFLACPAPAVRAASAKATAAPADVDASSFSPLQKNQQLLTTPGDHVRKLTVDGLERQCLIHIPKDMDPAKPSPLILVLHGAGMNSAMMASFSGMSRQADSSKFIAVYPHGTGLAETFLTWNSGGIGPARQRPDDVAFIKALLDVLETVFKLDRRRIFAAGLSNGGMMTYRLGAELSDRIAAIAAVGGTLAISDPKPTRPVPAIHFHGTEDRFVPYAGPGAGRKFSFRSVTETTALWAKLCGCPEVPVIRDFPDQFDDSTSVRISRFGPGKSGAEVVQVDILGGGHTWPGQQPGVSFVGKSTREISANQMIWEFFQKHPMPVAEP